MRTKPLSAHATTVRGDAAGRTAVTYHETEIVSFTAESVTLQSNGWRTATTLRKMNEAASQFRLPFIVKQKRGEWLVWLVLRDETVPYSDGMQISRRAD